MNKTVCVLTEQLIKYYRQIDPSIRIKMNPPAEDSSIRKIEERIGFPIPPDLKDFLSCHNGQVSVDADPLIPQLLFPKKSLGHTEIDTVDPGFFCSAERIYEINDGFDVVVNDVLSDGPMKTLTGQATFHDKLLMFCETFNEGGYYIDPTPNADNRVGQILLVSEIYGIVIVVADSLSHFLNKIVLGFEDGRFIRNHYYTWFRACGENRPNRDHHILD